MIAGTGESKFFLSCSHVDATACLRFTAMSNNICIEPRIVLTNGVEIFSLVNTHFGVMLDLGSFLPSVILHEYTVLPLLYVFSFTPSNQILDEIKMK